VQNLQRENCIWEKDVQKMRSAIDASLTANSLSPNFCTAKINFVCLVYINLALPQAYSLYLNGLIS